MANPTTDKINSILKKKDNAYQFRSKSCAGIVYIIRCLTLLLQFPRSGRSGRWILLMMEDCRKHCMASNRKSDSFSPLEIIGSSLLVGSVKRAFNSCTGFAELVAGFRDRGLVDLSILGRPVDPLEGIICYGDEIAG